MRIDVVNENPATEFYYQPFIAQTIVDALGRAGIQWEASTVGHTTHIWTRVPQGTIRAARAARATASQSVGCLCGLGDAEIMDI